MNSTPSLSAIYHKINWRILPFLLLCYVFAFLDRINIGFAKLQMQQDIGLTDSAYGIAAGIFFLGYVLFEIPSNLYLTKIGARKTLSRIMILWGITSACLFLVKNAQALYILRFLLGVFEAGFAPGVIFYFTYWYAQSRMTSVLSIFMFAIPIGGIVGSPLSTWIMTAFHGNYGLAGWQWMFLLQGLPCIILGLIAFCFLEDKPEHAQWLSANEKKLLAADIASHSTQQTSFRRVLKDKRIYTMAFSYFCIIAAMYTISFWLATILRNAGITDVMEIGLYSIIPYFTAGISMFIFSRSADHYRERRWHCSVLAMLGAIALCMAAMMTNHFILFLISISLATAFMFSSYTIFWAMPSDFLKGQAAAGGIALINSLGLLGGFVSPSLIGFANTWYGNPNAGLFLMSGLLLIGSVVIALHPSSAKICKSNYSS